MYHTRPSTTSPNPTTGYRRRGITLILPKCSPVFQPQPILLVYHTLHSETTNTYQKKGLWGLRNAEAYIQIEIPNQNLVVS